MKKPNVEVVASFIVTYFSDRPPMTVTQMAKMMGGSRMDIKDAVNHLVKEGKAYFHRDRGSNYVCINVENHLNLED